MEVVQLGWGGLSYHDGPGRSGRCPAPGGGGAYVNDIMGRAHVGCDSGVVGFGGPFALERGKQGVSGPGSASALSRHWRVPSAHTEDAAIRDDTASRAGADGPISACFAVEVYDRVPQLAEGVQLSFPPGAGQRTSQFHHVFAIVASNAPDLPGRAALGEPWRCAFGVRPSCLQ